MGDSFKSLIGLWKQEHAQKIATGEYTQQEYIKEEALEKKHLLEEQLKPIIDKVEHREVIKGDDKQDIKEETPKLSHKRKM